MNRRFSIVHPLLGPHINVLLVAANSVKRSWSVGGLAVEIESWEFVDLRYLVGEYAHEGVIVIEALHSTQELFNYLLSGSVNCGWVSFSSSVETGFPLGHIVRLCSLSDRFDSSHPLTDCVNTDSLLLHVARSSRELIFVFLLENLFSFKVLDGVIVYDSHESWHIQKPEILVSLSFYFLKVFVHAIWLALI
jgi:hypothetical protein